MSIRELYTKLNVNFNGPVAREDIEIAQRRLNGLLPTQLRAWFLEANGFAGSSELWWWRFRPLEEVETIAEFCVDCQSVCIHYDRDGISQIRVGAADHYAIFCSQNWNLPFYAVNIRPDTEYYGEVIAAHAGEPNKAFLSARDFASFANLLFQKYDDLWLMEQ